MSTTPSVRFVIEGAAAEKATRDLFESGWFEGEWASERQRGGEPGVSTVSAQVVALAGGSVTTADKLLDWWARWRKHGEDTTSPLTVVLEGAKERVSLEGATRDALVDVLRTLHAPKRH
jgi:hypothetical protein